MFSFLLHGYCNNIYLGKGWVARYVCMCKRKSCVACKYSVFHVPGFFSSTRENQIRSNARGQRIIHGSFYKTLLFLPYNPHPHSPLYKKPMTKPALEASLSPQSFKVYFISLSPFPPIFAPASVFRDYFQFAGTRSAKPPDQ